jgi:plastocyanin
MNRIVLLAVVVSLASFGIACSSSGASGPTCDSPTTTTEVDMQNIAFTPSCVSATANDTLNLVNKDTTEHTFTVKGTSINVTIEGGQAATAPLTGIAPGTYSVTCQFHSQMSETLQVT